MTEYRVVQEKTHLNGTRYHVEYLTKSGEWAVDYYIPWFRTLWGAKRWIKKEQLVDPISRKVVWP